MSMLAEPRSRQKWSHDPRNTNWSNDKTKFGYQMLTKMGWSEGSGLGLNLSGNADHITVNKRSKGSNAGVGLKKSHDDDWISHQDDFNALLSSLNGNPTCETASPVEKMKASRHRYTKFVKSKDLSNASTDDLACIFGQRGKSSATTAQDEEEKDESDASEPDTNTNEENDELNVKTVESTLSMNEYFAKKMSALKQKKTFENSPKSTNINKINDTDSGVKQTEEVCITEKKKKKKKKRNDDGESPAPSPPPEQVETSGTVVESAECSKPEKKKKKKKKTKDDESPVPSPCSETNSNDSNELNGETCEVIKKKKKTKDEESPVPSLCSETNSNDGNELKDGSCEVIKKKKKKKKSKSDDSESPVPSPCPEVEEEKEIVDLVLENGLVKKKKRKRTEDVVMDNKLVHKCEDQVDEGVKKKKKKKKKEVVDLEE